MDRFFEEFTLKFIAKHTPTVEAIKIIKDGFSENPSWFDEDIKPHLKVDDSNHILLNMERVNGYDDRNNNSWSELMVGDWIIRDIVDYEDMIPEYWIASEDELFHTYISVGVLEGHASGNPIVALNKLILSSIEKTTNEINILDDKKDV